MPTVVANPTSYLVLLMFGGLAWAGYFGMMLRDAGLPIQYELTAYRNSTDPSALVVVTGRVHVRVPCVGGTVRTYYRAPGAPTMPAIRRWADNTKRIGRTEIELEATSPGLYQTTSAFEPPEWAQWIEWRLMTPAPCHPVPQGEIVVGVVEIPER